MIVKLEAHVPYDAAVSIQEIRASPSKPAHKARLADFGAERGIRGTRNPRPEARKGRGLCAGCARIL